MKSYEWLTGMRVLGDADSPNLWGIHVLCTDRVFALTLNMDYKLCKDFVHPMYVL